jgi:hypothetical protein
MQDELVLADSAGHTMIDIEAARAADRAMSEALRKEDQQGVRKRPARPGEGVAGR